MLPRLLVRVRYIWYDNLVAVLWARRAPKNSSPDDDNILNICYRTTSTHDTMVVAELGMNSEENNRQLFWTRNYLISHENLHSTIIVIDVVPSLLIHHRAH